ncbi:MAG: transporter substrate-binding domain-containing protein [Erysipelotrichaceae bacterium]|nr:transporter substrate-binding domain-containing protein [Erysipelotrichaceae bacterium]
MKNHNFRKLICLISAVLVLTGIFLPCTDIKADETKTVRVGWYYLDNFQEGMSDTEEKSGYSYEYLQAISAYTGWEYEYVYGDWSELFRQLTSGTIDIMAAVTRTPEREALFLFPSRAMAYEDYYIFKRNDETEINANDIHSLTGKKIGTIRDNLISTYFEEWLSNSGVDCEEVQFATFSDRDIAFQNKEVDCIVSVDNNVSEDRGFTKLFKIGSCDSCIAVSTKRQDLLDELNKAQSALFESDPYFIESLQIKYYEKALLTSYLSDDENRWVINHDTLTVGCVKDYLPFSGVENNEVTDVITDIFNQWINNLHLKNDIDITYKTYDNYSDMVVALRNDEVDAIFPVIDNIYISETEGIAQTSTIMDSTIYIIYKGEYNSSKTDIIAVSEHSAFQITYAKMYYPDSTIYYATSAEGCLQAVQNGDADCTMFNSGRAEKYFLQGKYDDLNSQALGQSASYCIGVHRGNTSLYSLMEKGVSLIDKSEITNIASRYISTGMTSYSLISILRNNLPLVIVLFLLILALIVVSASTYIRSARKELENANMQNRQLNIIQSVSTMFHAVYYGDFEQNIALEISNLKHIREFIKSGHTPKETMDALCANLIEPEYIDDLQKLADQEYLSRELLGKNSISVEYIGKTMGWCRAIAIPVEWKDDRLIKVLWCFESIKDQKEKEFRAQEEIKEALHKAEDASKAKSTFLFNMSHDIRTPMNAIFGYTELMKKNRLDDTKFEQYYKNTVESEEFLLNLINNVLETARIESGNVSLNEKVSENRIDEIVLNSMSNEMDKKHITLYKDIDIKHPYIMQDETKIEQILLNIVSNAVKYTPDGGSIYYTVKEEETDKEDIINIRTVIRDTGIGMSEEFLPHIFEKFAREKSTTDNKIPGTGLGLGIVKQLVELMNGTIDIESKLDVGTKVTIVIPHKIAEAPIEKKNEEAESYDISGKRILLAEDNELNAEIAMELLKETGAEIELAEDGQICVEMLKGHEPDYYDVILMDVQMPNMDGLEATRKIRELEDERSKISIIAMTANAFDEDKKRCLEAGMDDFVSKPIEVDALLKVLNNIINK